MLKLGMKSQKTYVPKRKVTGSAVLVRISFFCCGISFCLDLALEGDHQNLPLPFCLSICSATKTSFDFGF